MARQRVSDDLEVEDATEVVEIHQIQHAPPSPTDHKVHHVERRRCFSGGHHPDGIEHSADYGSSAVELVLSEFRKSDFLRFLLQLVHSREGDQISQLHCEIHHLRKQLVEASQGHDSHSPRTHRETLKRPRAGSGPRHHAFELTGTRKDTSEFDTVTIPCPSAVDPANLSVTRDSEMSSAVLQASEDLEGKVSRITCDTKPFVGFRQTAVTQFRPTAATTNRATVLPDKDNMKDSVRKAILHGKSYNVAEFYRPGLWASIATNSYFEYLTLLVIAVNSLWIAIDVDYNKATTLHRADAIFQVAEYSFFTFFLTELVIRFQAFETKRNCLKDFWFVFDATMVVMMFADLFAFSFSGLFNARDTSVLKLLRITRLTRMARMARLLKALPELVILIKGIFVAAKSVFFTLCLLTLLIYVFAIVFVQATEGTDIGEFYFRSVPYGMKSLLLYATLPDMAEMVDNVGDEHVILAVILLIFILLASLTVMNMLVGVLVEVVSAVSEVEREELKVTYVKNTLLDMLQKQGVLEDMMISRREFELLLIMPDAVRVIQDVGVDPNGLLDFTDHIFDKAGHEGLTFPDFISLMLSLRGSNSCTVRDIVGLRKTFLEETMSIHHVLSQQSKLIDDMRRTVNLQTHAKEDESQTSAEATTATKTDALETPSPVWAFTMPSIIGEDASD